MTTRVTRVHSNARIKKFFVCLWRRRRKHNIIAHRRPGLHAHADDTRTRAQAQTERRGVPCAQHHADNGVRVLASGIIWFMRICVRFFFVVLFVCRTNFAVSEMTHNK